MEPTSRAGQIFIGCVLDGKLPMSNFWVLPLTYPDGEVDYVALYILSVYAEFYDKCDIPPECIMKEVGIFVEDLIIPKDYVEKAFRHLEDENFIQTVTIEGIEMIKLNFERVGVYRYAVGY